MASILQLKQQSLCRTFPWSSRTRTFTSIASSVPLVPKSSAPSFHGLGSTSKAVTKAQASAAPAAVASSPVAVAKELQQWLESAGFPPLGGDLLLKDSQNPLEVVLTAARRFEPGEVILNIPENFSVTALDVASHPVLSPAASSGSSDLPLLALWLLWETNQGPLSSWEPYIRTFASPPLSPLLWTPDERAALLQGYSGLPVIEQKVAEIEGVYFKFQESLFKQRASEFPLDKFSLQAFKVAFVHVLSRAVFLASADIFALLPLADLVRHSPATKSVFQYKSEDASVVLNSDKVLEPGDEISASRGPELNNLDIALRFGEALDSNPFDFISFQAGLVAADPLFLIKKQVLLEEGFSEAEIFPLFEDRFPRQLLSYLRLARIQDSAQFPKVTFKADVVVNESNEYEVLMLILNECKERLTAYPQALEDDMRLLKGRSSGPSLFQSLAGSKAQDDSSKLVQDKKEQLAARLRASEKRILSNTVTSIRNRLAPIRGIPTKSGMGDPNLEIKEVFGMMEAGFSAPKKLWGELFKKDK